MRPLRLILSIILAVAATGTTLAEPSRWAAEGWKTDFSKHSIPFDEILSGGPPKDGIPAIDEPTFVPARSVKALGDEEPVIRLAVGETVRAYPLRIMMWHEIVNDVIAGKPLTITYCPLCNSAIVFERTVDGRVLDFGTTGKLRNSDLVMYDRQTESWWQQFTGEGIVGSYTGTELKMVPARLEAFGRLRDAHPDADVLVANDPSLRDYGRNPYTGYDSAPFPMLYRGDMPANINPMARVIVVKAGKKPMAVALSALRKRGKIELGGVELSWSKGQNSALDRAAIGEGRDVGNVVATRRGRNGAEPVVHDVTFAFVAHAFYPDIDIVTE